MPRRCSTSGKSCEKLKFGPKSPKLRSSDIELEPGSGDKMDGPDTLHITGVPPNALFRVFVIINVSQKLFRKIQCLGDAREGLKVQKNPK